MNKKIKIVSVFTLSLGLSLAALTTLALSSSSSGFDFTDLTKDTAQFERLKAIKKIKAPISIDSQAEKRNPSAIIENEDFANLTSSEILRDSKMRISSDFKIPKGLKKRVSFWFDIYTKYGNAEHVVHHTRYPWIVYKVIDTRSLIRDGQGPLWLRRQRAENHVKSERRRIQQALVSLSKRRSYKKLPTLEKNLYQILSQLKGKRQSVFKFAANNLRSQLGQKDYFLAGLKNSAKYMSYMEEEFRANNVPTELTRLPFVESSFNEDAESKVGASGIWQIMPTTGKAFFIVSSSIDERNSPLKATRVAAKILRQNHRSLKRWPLAVTAYNHGIGSLKKAIRATKTDDLVKIIDIYHRGSFKFASSNFYTCFLAALYAEKYHYEIFNEHIIQKEKLQVREIVTLARSLRVKDVLRVTGLAPTTLKSYNLDIKNAIQKNDRLPKGFRLHLPLGVKEKFNEYISKNESSSDKV